MSQFIHRLVVGALLALHALLLGYSAARHSPTWDEVAHLPAGTSHWNYGRFDLYCVNPPLVRMVASAPVVLSQPRYEWKSYYDRPDYRSEFLVGQDFVTANGSRSFWYFTLARWACIPFSLIGGYACYRWAQMLSGKAAGIVALVLWCFCPNILGHGQLFTPDMGGTALGLLASYLFWRWLREPGWSTALAAGVALGLAELTKFTLVVLFPLWPMLWLFWRCSEPSLIACAGPLGERPVSPAARGVPGKRNSQRLQLTAILLLGVTVINLAYGCEGSFTRLGDFRFVTAALGGPLEDEQEASNGRNRFAGTWLAAVPVPVPRNYLLGIDVQKKDFEKQEWSYLRGQWRFGGWWYYYLYALAIKVPLGTWCLILLAAGYRLSNAVVRTQIPASATNASVQNSRETASNWRDEVVLMTPAVVVLALVSSHTGFNHHMRYVLPVIPFLFIWASKVAKALESKQLVFAALAGVAIFWSVASSLHYYPHGMSYFNELAGGPKGGPAHLLNSNIDYGQDLLYLKRWLDRHPEAGRPYLAYYVPLVDPRIAGIDYRPSPFEPSARSSGGPFPGWYAISVNKLHGHEKRYAHFLDLEPDAMAGYTIYLYRISLEEANRMRRDMGWHELTSSDLSDELTGDAR